MKPKFPVYEVREYSDWGEVRKLRSVWDEMAAVQDEPNLFLSFDWYETWWSVLGYRYQLLVLTAEFEGQTVAIAPMMIARSTVFRLPYNEIRFISTLDVAYSAKAFSGTQNLIFSEGHKAAIRVLADYLFNQTKKWTHIRLHPIPVNSGIISDIENVAHRHRLAHYKAVNTANACLYLDSSWDEYLSNLSAGLKKNMRRAFRALEGVAYEFKEVTTAGECEDAIQWIHEIEKKSWKHTKGVRFTSNENNGLYDEVIRSFGKRGWLRIIFLFINGEPAAYDLHIEYQGYINTLKGSFNPEFKDYSPGALITWYAYEKFHHEGVRKVDLLWGNLDYKVRWTNRLLAHGRIIIVNRGVYPRLIDFLMHSDIAQKTLKKMRKKSRRKN